MRKTSVHAASALILLSSFAGIVHATTMDPYFTMRVEAARAQGQDLEQIPAAALVLFRGEVTREEVNKIFQGFNLLGGLAAGSIATARGSLADFVRLADAHLPEVIQIEASRPVYMNECAGGLNGPKPPKD